MRIQRSIDEPIRDGLTWDQYWKAEDNGTIVSWEVGRAKRFADPELAAEAKSGRLVPLAWKGGVEKGTKVRHKFGTLFYLAMWQGLRGEDLDIDLDAETSLTCSVTGVTITYTGDYEKYAKV